MFVQAAGRQEGDTAIDGTILLKNLKEEAAKNATACCSAEYELLNKLMYEIDTIEPDALDTLSTIIRKQDEAAQSNEQQDVNLSLTRGVSDNAPAPTGTATLNSLSDVTDDERTELGKSSMISGTISTYSSAISYPEFSGAARKRRGRS